MSAEILLEIAENVLQCLPSRLREKYTKLKTELSCLDLKSSAPDFGNVELQPLSRSRTTEYRKETAAPPLKDNKCIQVPHNSFNCVAATQSELPVLHSLEVTQITEILDEVYLVLRQLRSSINPTAKGRPKEEGPGPGSLLNAVQLLSSPTKDDNLLPCLLNGCRSILEEAECCARHFSMFNKNLSDSVAMSRVASSTLANMERENSKLHSIIHERDRQISQLLTEAELHSKVHAELKEHNKVLEHNINILQERVDGFNQKLVDSDRLFKECNAAYLTSLATLRKEAGRQIAHLGNQLAITHDRLRRMKGKVEDLSMSGSMLTASILAD